MEVNDVFMRVQAASPEIADSTLRRDRVSQRIEKAGITAPQKPDAECKKFLTDCLRA